MTKYLLDTNVVSALAPGRPGKPPPDPVLVAWLLGHAGSLYLSTVTQLEIEAGLHKLGRVSPGRFHQQMSAWFSRLMAQFSDRVIPLDSDVAKVAAAITDENAARGLDPGLADIVIAATAAHHRLTLLTRNLRHFTVSGIAIFDPFADLPGRRSP